jgi:hypothetical protein
MSPITLSVVRVEEEALGVVAERGAPLLIDYR